MTRRQRIIYAALLLSITSWGACESRTTSAAPAPSAKLAESARYVELTPLPATAPPAVVAAVGVDRYRHLALAAGWSAQAWPRVRCIIRRESNGNPNAYNRGDGHGGSRGLMQINGVHTKWLIRKGIINDVGDLFDPYLNLRAARAVWRMQGWHAWYSKRHPC